MVPLTGGGGLLIAARVPETRATQPAEEQHRHGGERQQQISELFYYHGSPPTAATGLRMEFVAVTPTRSERPITGADNSPRAAPRGTQSASLNARRHCSGRVSRAEPTRQASHRFVIMLG